MKILWLTNTPCGATERLTGQAITGGGWLYALSEHIKTVPNIELHIAFYHKVQMPSFAHEGIWYHPIYHKSYSNKWQLIIGQFKARFSQPSDDDDINRVLSIVTEVKPDIIHVHGSEENFGLIAQHLPNENIVLSIQGLLNPCMEKLYAGIPKRDIVCRELITHRLLNMGSVASERQFVHNANRERQILSRINHIIGRTKWDFDCSLALNPNRKYYIVNEILRSEFLTHKWEPRSNKEQYVISTTVSNGLYKGVEAIYKAAKVLKNANFNFKWNVIGISSSDYITKIVESFIGENASNLNLELVGRKNAQQMLEIFDASDLFVQVSHIENSPNSLCEAMVIGIPIIATFAGGTSSMMTDGIEGVLVQDGDPYSLSGAIVHSSQNYTEMQSMSDRARNRALIRHWPENVCSELISVYKTILGNK